MSVRSWRFTLNNPTESELEMVKLWEVSRCAITMETGSEGTPHLQGFVTWTRTCRLPSLKKLAPRAHWEPSATADWNYELKTDSTPVRIEDNRAPGARKDVDAVYDAVEQGLELWEFVRTRPTMVQIKLFNTVRAIHPPRDRNIPVTVIWVYGPTNAGKSGHIRDFVEAKTGKLPYTPVNFKWWENYHGQKVVLIDDFRGDWCKYHELLVLIDRYGRTVEFKGSSVNLVADVFYFTSCHHPRDVYAKSDEDIKQLLRRITRVVYTDSVYQKGQPFDGLDWE